MKVFKRNKSENFKCQCHDLNKEKLVEQAITKFETEERYIQSSALDLTIYRSDQSTKDMNRSINKSIRILSYLNFLLSRKLRDNAFQTYLTLKISQRISNTLSYLEDENMEKQNLFYRVIGLQQFIILIQKTLQDANGKIDWFKDELQFIKHESN